MKATETKVLDFIKKSPQFVIPIYQRTYSWTERECRQLWDDIMRTGSDDRISVHFVGSIVYIDRADSNITSWEPMLVIDGQQRLTTLMLLIAALVNAVGKSEPIDGFSAEKLRGYYLINPLESGEFKFKMILTQTDKKSLISIIDNQEQPAEYSFQITENFKLFKDLIASDINKLDIICKGIAKLMMVDIKLKRGEDNPQLIFESMNSTGKKLSQADLIRNYILMGLEHDIQTRLYELYWRPMEKEFGQEAYSNYFDAFMRYYLTVKTGDIPRLDEVYESFKMHATLSNVGIEELVKDIRNFAGYFCAIALNHEPETSLKNAFHDLREFKVDVAYPFLLELYHDYKNDTLSKDDLLASVRLIESYVFRRAICNIPTNSLNKTFATFAKFLKKDRYLESIQAQFLSLPSYRRFPNDDEFKRELMVRDLYNFPRRSYWLRRLENHGRKERIDMNDYTIEHILPQNENLSQAWKDDLGDDWKNIHETWLHTIGNLSLTGYNQEYSDRPFKDKRDMPGGFKESPLKLNIGLGQIDIWNEVTIKDRAKRLCEIALNVWELPNLSDDIINAYKSIENTTSVYSINDHSNLLSGVVKELFEELRKEILAIDPVVREEFLKLYVAYKAETNFVDVVPQAKRLRLSLNMPFADIDDPQGLCKDVSSVGRWGNGDVEIGYSSLQELPYIMGLIRQSFERQIDNGDN